VDAALGQTPLETVIDTDVRTVSAGMFIREVLAILTADSVDALYVTDDRHRLAGVVTRSDLLRAVDRALELPERKRSFITIRQVMSADPVAVSRDDSPRTAATLLWGEDSSRFQ